MKMSSREAHALWVVAPGRAELRTELLPELGPGQVLVEARFSGISRGTESLVFRGGVPAELHASMRCPHQAGELSLPVKYGYCSVGKVAAAGEGAGAELVGQRVFCLHPHQDRYVVPASSVVPLPAAVPDRRAVLAANMETAVNGLWDAAPLVGSRVAVIGAGAVGLLSASLLQRIPGVELEVVDIAAEKAELCRELGLGWVRPEAARRECDLVLHASGSPAGLQTALELAGQEATIVELSWYGDRAVSLQLGGRFHNGRFRIVSSQVGSVAPSQRPRWSYRRRMELALQLLADVRYDALLAAPVPFDSLPQALPGLFARAGCTVTELVEYPTITPSL
jgi:2-desacetyl-2-hydroxyethyl bacteriochlorophyllide A dehydrogenase